MAIFLHKMQVYYPYITFMDPKTLEKHNQADCSSIRRLSNSSSLANC